MEYQLATDLRKITSNSGRVLIQRQSTIRDHVSRSGQKRTACVGEKAWAKVDEQVCNTFTTAQVRYFDHSEAEAAWSGWHWLEEMV